MYKLHLHVRESILHLVQMCAQYYPLEYNSTSYSVTVSGYATNDNLTTIQVYYCSLKYAFITQQAKMHVFDIISNIGGTKINLIKYWRHKIKINFFVRMSFVTLFEAAEIFKESVFL